jgi:hypothetical protein
MTLTGSRVCIAAVGPNWRAAQRKVSRKIGLGHGASVMRRALSLLFALALSAGGIYVLSLDLFYPHLPNGGRIMGKFFLMGCSMAGIGAYWLWADFLSPNRERL